MDARPKKICFVGAPSTGKTTLARAMAAELAKKNYHAEVVEEFARDYIIEHGAIEGPQAQLAIARGQKEREKMAKDRNPEFVVCDCATFLCPVYFHFLYDGISDEKEINELKEIEKELWQELGDKINDYDFVFFLPPEFAPEKDGVRLYTDKVEEISNRIKEFLNTHNIKYHELRGTVQERADKVFKIMISETASTPGV